MIIKELQEQGTPFESRGEGVEIPSDPAKSNRTPNLVYARAKLDKQETDMTRGRKKLPDELKALRGTDQPCRMSGDAASTESVVVSLPRSGLKGAAKKVFEVVATELIHKNLLDLVGVDLVVAYAREMGLYHDMMREVDKEGYTLDVETKFGTTKIVNPKRKIAESALMNAKSLAAEFGLTPASRGRVAALLSDDGPKDEFAEFEEVK